MTRVRLSRTADGHRQTHLLAHVPATPHPATWMGHSMHSGSKSWPDSSSKNSSRAMRFLRGSCRCRRTCTCRWSSDGDSSRQRPTRGWPACSRATRKWRSNGPHNIAHSRTRTTLAWHGLCGCVGVIVGVDVGWRLFKGVTESECVCTPCICVPVYGGVSCSLYRRLERIHPPTFPHPHCHHLTHCRTAS